MKKLILLVIGLLMFAGCDALRLDTSTEKIEANETKLVKENPGPDGFFGLKFGSTVEQAKNIGLVWNCSHLAGGCIACNSRKTQIGEIDIIAGYLYFYGNQFDTAIVKINKNDMETILSALMNKYGPATFVGKCTKGFKLWQWDFENVRIYLHEQEDNEVYNLTYKRLSKTAEPNNRTEIDL